VTASAPWLTARDRVLTKWLGALGGGFAVSVIAATLARRIGIIGREQERSVLVVLAIGFVVSLIVFSIVIIVGRQRGGTPGLQIDTSRMTLVLADAAEVAREKGLPTIDERCLLTAALDDADVVRALALAAVDLQSIQGALAPEPSRALDDATYRLVKELPRLELTSGASRLLRGAARRRGMPGPRPIDLLIAATTMDTDARLTLRTVVSRHDLEVAAAYVDVPVREPEREEDGLVALLLHDDDVTPMLVARDLLVEVLGLSRREANHLATRVHDTKSAVTIGRFAEAIAEEHAATLMKLARERGYALRATTARRRGTQDGSAPHAKA
jgi:ATP-dependent Clp protease adapter protein ClpS